MTTAQQTAEAANRTVHVRLSQGDHDLLSARARKRETTLEALVGEALTTAEGLSDRQKRTPETDAAPPLPREDAQPEYAAPQPDPIRRSRCADT
jgi:hypothetical protein